MTEFRALLLTDVVDSTKLSEAIGDEAMAEVWTAHDRVARDLLPQWRGREIDKTDGMLMLFDTRRRRGALRAGLPPRAGRAGGAAEGARRPARRAGDPAREQRRGRRARRQAAGGGRPGQAHRGARHVAGARWADAAHARGARGARQDGAQGAVARPLDDQGRGRPDRVVRGRSPEDRFAAPPTARRSSASCRPATGGCRSRKSPTTCRTRAPRSSVASARSTRSRRCSAAARLVTLLGMGGLGKTRLSLQVAAERCTCFPTACGSSTCRRCATTLVVAEAARVLDVRRGARTGRCCRHCART